MDPRPVVIVTGAARRIGRAIALDLAAHGWDVAVHHHRSGEEEALATVDAARRLGARAEALQADLGDPAQCETLLPRARQLLERVDAVVNNASHFEIDEIASFDPARMERHWRANTAAPILLARALAAAGRGTVVNILDQKLWNPNPDYFSYTLSKAALESATTMLAMALAPAVRVAGVAPGITLPSDLLTGEAFERAHRMTPLGRSSTPEDIAHAVRFVLESPAITGTTIVVDGGQHLLAQPRDVLHLAARPA